MISLRLVFQIRLFSGLWYTYTCLEHIVCAPQQVLGVLAKTAHFDYDTGFRIELDVEQCI